MQSQFKQHLADLVSPHDPILVAVSGGVDSVVLCELMHQSGQPFSMAHCNFHLRPGDCDRDQQFVLSLAQRYGVPLFVAQFDTQAHAKAQGQSVEEAARNLRYAFFQEVLDGRHQPLWQPQGQQGRRPLFVATAHHRDDATETFFINLLRGTGLAGLHGIQTVNGTVIRPLLAFGRDAIEAFARQNGLAHVEDCTNATLDYQRNRIRHQLMPLLRQLAPHIDATMQQNIRRLSEAEQVFDLAVSDLRQRLVQDRGEALFVDVAQLPRPQATLLFHLLKPYGFTSAVVDELLATSHAVGTHYLSPTHRLVVDREGLLVSPLREQQPSVITLPVMKEGSPQQSVSLSAQARLRCETGLYRGQPVKLQKSEALFDLALLQQPLQIRPWKDGDRFRPYGMSGSQLVSDYFSTHHFSLLQKEQTLLLTDAAGTILWIIGHRAAHHATVTAATTHLLHLTLTSE